MREKNLRAVIHEFQWKQRGGGVKAVGLLLNYKFSIQITYRSYFSIGNPLENFSSLHSK